MGKKHILVISQYFYPEQMRINDICQEWIRRGYKVTVVTGIPNYPKGKFYDGYGWLKKRKEKWNGIDIVRIPIIARGNTSIKLVFNYISFVISGFFWSLFSKIKANAVYIYQMSPMTQALPGVWYAKKNKIPCILYVTDLWPDNVQYIANINNKFILNNIERMCQYIYKKCDTVLTSSKGFIRILAERKVPLEKLRFWPQYAEEFYRPVNKSENEIPLDGRFNILFAGNVGYSQGLDILPSVAKILKFEKIYVRFNILGDGRFKEDLVKLVKKNDVSDMFNFIDKKLPRQVPYYIANSDAVLISLRKNKAFDVTLPAKLQSYLACEKPILGSADGEIQQIINDSKSGLCSDAEDVDGLIDIIKKMYSLSLSEKEYMSKNARKYNEKYFDKNKRLNEIDNIFKNFIGDK